MKAPAPLNEGDTIAIISPAGALRNKSIVDASVAVMEKWGLKVVVMPHTLSSNGYYSGTAEERGDDLSSAMLDKRIKAVLCSYGGYGCIHLTETIATLIESNPKWIIGMSDCSVLHAVCLSKGVMSIHSPQCNHLSKFPDSTSAKMLKKILFGEKPTYSSAPHMLDIHGETKGSLVGGNMTVLTSLIGSCYDIFREGTILFIEDIGEQPYRIERMMYHLELSGGLSRIKGLIVGELNGIKENSTFGAPYELIHHIIKKYDIPVCFGFPVGHCDDNIPLIEGAECHFTVNENGTILDFNI